MRQCDSSTKPLLRAASNGIINGYIALWGTPDRRDCYNTWFDRNNPPDLGLDFLPIPLLYEHGMDPVVKKAVIGRVTAAWIDDTGVAFRAELDKKSPHYKRVLDEIGKGELATSSGTADHIAEFDDEGRFVSWRVFELSLTNMPCEYDMPTVKMIRSGRKNVMVRSDKEKDEDCGCGESTISRLSKLIKASTDRPKRKRKVERRTKMKLDLRALADMGVPEGTDPLQLLAALVEEEGFEAVMSALQSMGEEAPEAAEEEEAVATASALSVKLASILKEKKRDEEIESLRMKINRIEKAATTDTNVVDADRNPSASRKRDNKREADISGMMDLRFDHMSARDMVCGYSWMDALRASGKVRRPLSTEYLRAMEAKTVEAIEKKDQSAIRSLRGIRANELMGSTVAGSGDEWVSIFYDNSLWEVIRQSTIYETLISKGITEREVPQGTESVKLMLEGSDPTWYVVGQTADEDATGQPQTKLTSSKYGTVNTDLTVAKLGAAILLTGELEEDSLIAVIPEARRKLDISAQETIEYILVNGDTVTSANTNINLIDGTPTATSLGSMPRYTLLNGFIKVGLLGGSGANARDGGALTVEDYLETLKLMGTNGKNAIVRDKVLFVIDNMTYYATLALADVKSRDVFVGPTIENGEISKMWGRDIYVSEQMALANTAGKISATPANNTKGRILAIRPDQWVLGWKRRMTTEVQRWSRADSTELVTYLRMGLVNRDTEAAAISYNLTV